MVRALLRRPGLADLDHAALLVHNHHWVDPKVELRFVDNHTAKLHSLRTDSTPAFLHYNGYTKQPRRFRWPFSVDSMATLQRIRHQERHPVEAIRRSRFDAWLEHSARILDVQFRRQRGLSWPVLCGHDTLQDSWQRAIFGQHRAVVPAEYVMAQPT